MAGIHRQAPEGIFVAGAGGNKAVIPVVKAQGVLQVAVPADALLFQQGHKLPLAPFIGGVDAGFFVVFKHRGPPSYGQGSTAPW